MDILNIIVEEVKKFLNEYDKSYTIPELAEMVSRMGIEKEIILKLLQDSFRNGGDDYVVETFFDITHIQIYPISKGRYIFTEPVGGD